MFKERGRKHSPEGMGRAVIAPRARRQGGTPRGRRPQASASGRAEPCPARRRRWKTPRCLIKLYHLYLQEPKQSQRLRSTREKPGGSSPAVAPRPPHREAAELSHSGFKRGFRTPDMFLPQNG